ncbi:MAG TPA: glycosyltransferase family 39 protein [Candidatus Obscuribacterales bacterium]
MGAAGESPLLWLYNTAQLMHSSDSTAKIFDKLHIAMMVFGVFSIVALYAFGFYRALTCPYSLNYEGVPLWASWALAHGLNIYDPARLSAEPWSVNIYPPLMPIIGQLASAKVAGCLIFLRALSAVCAVGTAILLWLLWKRSAVDRVAAAAALVFVFSPLPVWFNSFMCKPDFLCIFFIIATLLVFWLKYERDELSTKALLPCVALSVLALLGKQQGVLAPATICVFLLVRGKTAAAVRFGCIIVAAFALTGIVFQLITGGVPQIYAFLKQLHWDYNNVGLNVSTLAADGIKLGLISAGAILYIVRKQVAMPQFQFACIFLVLSVLQCLSSLGIPAATSNHFILPFIGFAMVAALVGTRWTWFAAALAVVSVILVIDLALFLDKQVSTVRTEAAGVLQQLPHQGKLLSEDPYWVFATGTELVMVDCNIFQSVWRQRPQLQQPFIDRLKSKAYAAVMINHRDSRQGGNYIWTPEALAAIKENYRLAGSGTGNGISQDIYLPK